MIVINKTAEKTKKIFNQTIVDIQTFVEQQDNSINDLLQIVEEQYKQLNQQHSQIKEIENQVSSYFDMSNILHVGLSKH